MANSLVFSNVGVDNTPCIVEIVDSKGFITSDSSDNYKYCGWIITVPRDNNIRLKFISFQLSELPSLGLHSWIRLYDGKSTNATLLGIYTRTRRPFTVQSSGCFLLVTLTTQHELSLRYFKGGFTAASTIGEFVFSSWYINNLSYLEPRTAANIDAKMYCSSLKFARKEFDTKLLDNFQKWLENARFRDLSWFLSIFTVYRTGEFFFNFRTIDNRLCTQI